MNMFRLQGPLLFYTLITVLGASGHLFLRVWNPADSSVKPFASKQVQLHVPDATVPDEITSFLAGFNTPASDETSQDAKPTAKGDTKELGNLYVTLLAVYKSGSSHKAILEITEKESGKRYLEHLGLGDSFKEVQIESVTGTSCKVRFRDVQLNFRLFAPERAVDASVD